MHTHINSFSQLQEDISWISQRTSDSLHTIAVEMEKNEKNAATEHAQLIAKVTAALEESSKEGQENSQRMKELLEMQIGELEKVGHGIHTYMHVGVAVDVAVGVAVNLRGCEPTQCTN